MNSAASSLRCLARACGGASSLVHNRRRCSCVATCGRGPPSTPIAKRHAHHVSRLAPGQLVGDGRQQLPWPTTGAHPSIWPGKYGALRPIHSCNPLRNNSSDSHSDGAEEVSSSPPTPIADEQPQLTESFTDVPGTTNTQAKKLAIIYTCKVCNTRSAKQFTEHSYKHGVVLVRCPGCQNLHLIADNLGWFEEGEEDGEGWNVEKVLARAGENVKAVSGEDVLELTLNDVMGKKEE